MHVCFTQMSERVAASPGNSLFAMTLPFLLQRSIATSRVAGGGGGDEARLMLTISPDWQ